MKALIDIWVFVGIWLNGFGLGGLALLAIEGIGKRYKRIR